VTTVNATSSTGGTSESGLASGVSQMLNSDEFIRILLAEVQNQNPLEPMDNSELVNQMTSIQSLEATSNLNKSINTMMIQQQILGAGALIGHWATGVSQGDGRVTGVVEGVCVQGENVNLVVSGYLVPVANVEEVGPLSEEQEANNGS